MCVRASACVLARVCSYVRVCVCLYMYVCVCVAERRKCFREKGQGAEGQSFFSGGLERGKVGQAVWGGAKAKGLLPGKFGQNLFQIFFLQVKFHPKFTR